MKLYEIREEIETALLTPEDEHFSPHRIDELNMAFDAKVENCVAVIKNLNSAADQSAEMERIGKQKVKIGIHQARIANSPVSAIVFDPDRVSLEFKENQTITRIDKKAIIAHFKETGEILKGTEIVQGTHLRVS